MNAAAKPHAAGVRGKPVKKLAALARHVRGGHRSLATELADTGRENVLLAPSMTQESIEQLRAERKAFLKGKRGRPPAESAEFVIWGPPRHAAEDAWDRQRCIAWAEDTVAWVRRHFPDSPIIVAALHMDEGSPHCHVQVFPRHIDPNGLFGYGLARADRAATARLAGRPVEFNDGPQVQRSNEQAGADAALLLDSYHAEVGSKHGLGRGVLGSNRKHKAITQDEASRRHAEDRETELERERERLRETEQSLGSEKAKVIAEEKRVAAHGAEVERKAKRIDVKARTKLLNRKASKLAKAKAKAKRIREEGEAALEEAKRIRDEGKAALAEAKAKEKATIERQAAIRQEVRQAALMVSHSRDKLAQLMQRMVAAFDATVAEHGARASWFLGRRFMDEVEREAGFAPGERTLRESGKALEQLLNDQQRQKREGISSELVAPKPKGRGGR